VYNPEWLLIINVSDEAISLSGLRFEMETERRAYLMNVAVELEDVSNARFVTSLPPGYCFQFVTSPRAATETIPSEICEQKLNWKQPGPTEITWTTSEEGATSFDVFLRSRLIRDCPMSLSMGQVCEFSLQRPSLAGFSGETPTTPTIISSTPTTVPATPTAVTPTAEETLLSPLTFTPEASLLRLVYDEDSFYMVNLGTDVVDISNMVFRQEDPSGRTVEFEANDWAQSSTARGTIFALSQGGCYQIFATNSGTGIIPFGCEARYGWIVTTTRRFWVAANDTINAFTIYNEDEAIATCEIDAGMCEFSIDG
jgi:hypothetical protein